MGRSHWKNYNANPRRRRTGDCTIRAICTALDGHVVAVIEGEYYDTWESGDEEPIYYWIIKDGEEK